MSVKYKLKRQKTDKNLKNSLLQRLGAIKWMNKKALPNEAYVPTYVEHVANVITTGIWSFLIVKEIPEFMQRAAAQSKLTSALIYSVSLILIIFISTLFHIVHCCFHKGGFSRLKNILHRCDRTVLFIFIFGAYYPWLNSEDHLSYLRLQKMRSLIWFMTAFGIIYEQLFHEKYKTLDTIVYSIIAVVPGLAAAEVEEYYNIIEVKIGAVIYAIGVLFFKLDGRVPFAHAIWHTCSGIGGTIHYYAMVKQLYSK